MSFLLGFQIGGFKSDVVSCAILNVSSGPDEFGIAKFAGLQSLACIAKRKDLRGEPIGFNARVQAVRNNSFASFAVEIFKF
jgi:hypothetical protein